MATNQDVELLEAFLQETLATSRLVIEFGDIRAREREALRTAAAELEVEQPERIITAYREMSDDALVAAGVLGQQLAAKVEISRVFVELLRAEAGAQLAPPERRRKRSARGPLTGNVRRWIKRAKVLVGTLAGLLPPVEALAEMLDLLDAALDRPAYT